jgi:23S rRNA (uracil1939-C5)-methyltransferase
MQLRIEKAIYGGAGLARSEGKAIFVPYTLPGELVDARVTQDRGSYANGELSDVLEPSPTRAQPPCPYFGECGGCHYQHAAYSLQVEMKAQILRETLERAHLPHIPEIETLSGAPLGYRNRIRLHIDPDSSQLAYRRRASHTNLVVDACPIAAPMLEQALKATQQAAAAWRLGEFLEEMEFFTNDAQNSLLVDLTSRSNPKLAVQRLQDLWPELMAVSPNLAGAAIFSSEQPGKPRRLLGIAGEDWLPYAAAGHTYRVSAGSFFQVNRFLIDPLVELVTADQMGKLAWDLYAGVGVFAYALAARFEQVVAVESAPGSVRDLQHNLRDTPHDGSRSIAISASTTHAFLGRARRTPDLVVLDPPRAGLGKETASLLAALRPARITYVSCDPATLSRDLKSLLDSGYRLRKMHMVDLFPETFHLESVAQLSLG